MFNLDDLDLAIKDNETDGLMRITELTSIIQLRKS